MNKGKKFTAAVAATAVASAMVAPIASASVQFSDIEGSYAKAAILELAEKGIIVGENGKFSPTANIKRQDFAIIMAKALNLDLTNAPATPTFTDVPTNHYSYAAVEAAVKAGLLKGEGNGKFGLGTNLSREAMAVIFVNALGVNVVGKGAELKFADAGSISSWAKDQVAFAVEAGLLRGDANNKFNPLANAERQQVAVVASNFLKAQEDYKVGQLTGVEVAGSKTLNLTFTKAVESLAAADVTVKEKATGTAVTVSGVALAEDKKTATATVSGLVAGTTYTVSYKGKSFDVVAKEVNLEVASVVGNTTKSLKVNFTEAVEDTSKVTFDVKRGATNVILAAEWSADKKSAILSSVANLYVGEYEVTVNGAGIEEGRNTGKVTIEAEKAVSIEMITASVYKTGAEKLKFEVKNQYGELIAVSGTSVVYTAYDRTDNKDGNGTGPVVLNGVAGKSEFTADFTAATLADGDEVLVTLSYNGLTTTKVVKVMANGALKTFQLNQPVPLKDKTRISVGETIELPYAAADQYGEATKLAQQAADADGVADQEKIGDYVFTSSDKAVVDIDTLAIDADGKMTFVTAGKGTAKITAVNLKTAEITSVTVEVFDVAAADAITLTTPNSLIVADETVKVPYTAVNQFGEVIKPDDLNKASVVLSSTDNNKATVAWNGNDIVITGVAAGNVEIKATIGTKVAKFSVDVQAKATATKVTGVKDLATILTPGAVATISPSNLIVKDQYGRDYKLKGTEGAYVYLKDGLETSLDLKHTGADVSGANLANGAKITADGQTSVASITGKATTGSETLVIQLVSDATNTNSAVAGGTFEVAVQTKAATDIVSYEIKDLPTLYAKGGNDYTVGYAKAVEVVAKDAQGNIVAFPAANYLSVTSSNPAVAKVDTASNKVLGVTKGTATISAVIQTANGVITVQKDVTVSDEALVAQKVELKGTKVTAGSSAVTITALDFNNVVAWNDATEDLAFVVTDQFGGTDLSAVYYAVSDIFDADNDGFTAADVTPAGGDITLGANAKAGDKFTITAVTANGKTAKLNVTIGN